MNILEIYTEQYGTLVHLSPRRAISKGDSTHTHAHMYAHMHAHMHAHTHARTHTPPPHTHKERKRERGINCIFKITY